MSLLSKAKRLIGIEPKRKRRKKRTPGRRKDGRFKSR